MILHNKHEVKQTVRGKQGTLDEKVKVWYLFLSHCRRFVLCSSGSLSPSSLLWPS